MKKRLPLLAALILLGGVLTAVALGEVSPSGSVTSGSTTLYWSGQGSDANFAECGTGADPGAGGLQNGATATNYMLWIFNPSDTVSGNPTLTVNNTTYGNAYFTNGVWQIVTPYVNPGSITPADPKDEASTGSAYASFTVGTLGNGSWILTISHGCAGLQLSISTSIHDNTSGADDVASAQLGDVVHDVATVSGATSGTVAFTWFANGTCSASGTSAGSATVDGSGVADGSSNQGPLAPGDYSFQATYNGSLTSGCEPLHVAVPKADAPTATKDANPSFERTFNWDIKKDVNQTQINVAGDGTATFDYTVSVTKLGFTDSGWSVSGTIDVLNGDALPITGATISDVVDDSSASCSVPTGSGATLSPGSTSFPYTCSYSGAPANTGTSTNTATITWPDQSINTIKWMDGGSAPAQATFDWSTPTTVTNDTINVTDTNGQAWSFGDTDSKSYSVDHQGIPGTCQTFDNTATITETDQKSSQEVKVCSGADLTVDKTVAPTFTRTYGWSIAKAVDNTRFSSNDSSQSGTFNYTVNVNQTGFSDSNYAITGTITVTNPNDWEPITASVSDPSCGNAASTVTVPAGQSVQVNYGCTGLTGGETSNTATATWDAGTYFTVDGSASGSVDFAFTTPTSLVNQTITPTDAFNGGLGVNLCTLDPTQPCTLAATDAAPFTTATYGYARTIKIPGTPGCLSYNNTAATGTGPTSSQTVTVCNTSKPPLTPGYWKNHAADSKSGSGHPNYSSDCSKLKYSSCSTNGPWAFQSLPQTLGSYPVGGILVADPIWGGMNCSSSTDQGAVGCLAGHLLAAKLNVANGSDLCINTTIASADAFLISVSYVGPSGSYPLTPALRSSAIALKSALDKYNNGGGC